MDKQDLRKQIKEKRRNLIYDKSLFVKKIQMTDFYKMSKNIMIFYPMKYEINLLSLLLDKTKNFYLPRVDGKNLQCCSYSEGDKLEISILKIQEPISEPVNKKIIDLVIVPALACDKQNYRLGYGGGYYDRFLKDFSGKTIVCIQKDFLIDKLPIDEYDIPVDLVITC